ncbi:MAG: T9SS type A sorting domain-containing protein [Saprospiraceae bacterium]|nr:T9SS type A sorting domain-containing protein [Saprospiraceae bacterium]
MKKSTLAIAVFCLYASILSSQTSNYFKPVAEGTISLRNGVMTRSYFPEKYQVFQLDYESAKNVLNAAPWEFTQAAREQKCLLSIPLADGTAEVFSIWRTAIMEPELAAQRPDIGTFAGRSVSNPARTVRVMYSPRGFRAMILQPDLGVAYVEPYAWGQDEYYISYDRADLPRQNPAKLGDGWLKDGTTAEPVPVEPYTPPSEERGVVIDPVQLKVYRYVAAATGEFGEDHGGTKDLVFAAIVDYTDRVNAIFERDVNIRLQLIAASQNVAFINPGSDPYSGQTVFDWAGQNQAVLNQYCNFNSHDIGHVYARYLGIGGAIGVSMGLGIVCGNNKGGGCSAGNGNGDYGDYFVGVIGQEVGHQLNGGHTWNRCGGGAGRHGNSAFEPGSGSTIMSYAGACGSDNVQGGADLYFHSGSVEEFYKFYTFGTGGNCGSSVTTGNFPPEVTLPYEDNFFIPILTPFEVNGSATDPDGDVLSYVWEEVDTGPEVPLGTESANSAIFRTYPSGAATNRYFPRLSTILNNGVYNAEILPEYTRDVTLRLIARDNLPGGGGVGWKDVAFKAWGEAGPFLVTAPNTASANWKIGEYVNVTWDVAKTDQAPVNCKNVNIRLSIDGGLTYPYTLASGVDNDGGQYVQVPDLPTSKARVRIDAADNIFFDVSNANFSIQQPTQPTLTFGLSNDAGQICLPDAFGTEILTAGSLGFSDPVTLSLDGNLPTGATATFDKTNLMPGENAFLTVDMNNVTEEGIFSFDVVATPAGGTPLVRTITLNLVSNDFSGLALQIPADGSDNQLLTQVLHWNAVPDAETYDVEFSKNPSFTNVLASKTDTPIDSFKIPFLLEKGTAYYWRVRPRNECGPRDWSGPNFFSTFAENCQSFTANDLPKNITANGTPTIETKITVNAGGIISDINVGQLKGYHEFFKDLEVHLVSPQGVEVLLFGEKCGNYNGFYNFGLSDDAPSAFPCPPANNGQIYRPQNDLSPFYGLDNTGTWTLRVKDNVLGAGGTIQNFKLEFCATASVSPPYLVNNNPLSIPTGTNALITQDLLLAEDANNTHAQLVFTLLTVPENGFLDRIGFGTLHPGDQFTQASLDAGEIRFFDYGSSSEPDGFRFTVSDGEGGFLGTPKFVILPQGVGTHSPGDNALDFSLFPNPASDAVWVVPGQVVDANTRISVFNASGQLIETVVFAAGADRIQLRTPGWARGLYLVRLESEKGTGVKKLILK